MITAQPPGDLSGATHAGPLHTNLSIGIEETQKGVEARLLNDEGPRYSAAGLCRVSWLRCGTPKAPKGRK